MTLVEVKAKDANLFKLFGFVQIWYFATAEDVADVFKEWFFQGLSVIKQEHCGFVFHTSEEVQALQIWDNKITDVTPCFTKPLNIL